MLQFRTQEQWYVEPFAGGMNTISRVMGKRIANDNNKYLISMWIGLQNNLEKPMEISREFYNDVKTSYNNNTNKYSDFIKGWVGFVGSFGGRFFEGCYNQLDRYKRDYIAERVDNILKQIPKMIGVKLFNKDYKDLEIPDNSIIYCDIPYKGVLPYSTSKNFNYEEFYDWVKEKHNQGHLVFISELQMPDDFICIWEKKLVSNLSDITNKKSFIDKLFVYKDNAHLFSYLTNSKDGELF